MVGTSRDMPGPQNYARSVDVKTCRNALSTPATTHLHGHLAWAQKMIAISCSALLGAVHSIRRLLTLR
ncbi:hypothetical protein GDO81_000071 [Engystomops pustulosus]|uniref:Uncharacterized protein n=1 Tax=Engystomops pustulosus TaxID=76066 RepID=A0AAV7D2I6_ENGPU|nr:hypothetical protein GDO81_000071 [Engystomops pustulosus]